MTTSKSIQKRTIIGIIIVLIIQLILMPFLNNALLRLLKLEEHNIFTFFLSRIIYWVSLLGVFLYSIKVEKRQILIWKGKKRSILFYLISSLCLTIIIYSLTVINHLVVNYFSPQEVSPQISRLIEIFNKNIWLVFFTSITAGLVEEVIFRGYIQTRLVEVTKNKIIGIALSATTFGLLHLGYGTIINILDPILLGIIFSIHYQWFKNIKILIILHSLYDIIILWLNLYLFNNH